MNWRGWQLKRPRIWTGGFYFSRAFAARSFSSAPDKNAMLRGLCDSLVFTWALLCRSQWSKSPWAIYSTMSRIGLVVVQQPKKLRTFWCFPTLFMSSISSINSFFSSSFAFSGDNKDRWVQTRKTNSGFHQSEILKRYTRWGKHTTCKSRSSLDLSDSDSLLISTAVYIHF